MSLFQKLDARRLRNGALLLGAIAAAWAVERRNSRNIETYPSGWAVDAAEVPPRAGWLGQQSAWWKTALVETYAAMSANRLIAVAAGVVFYALMAIFPAITAFVSFYGLFADPGTIQNHLALLSNVLPADGLEIVQEQIARIASAPSGLSVGFIAGLLVALWSANSGVKAMIDALNVIEGHDERRSFVQLNLLSLTLTLGAIGFLLLAVSAVVAFPLVMSTFGLKNFSDATTWLVRWPLLLVLVMTVLTVFYRFGPSRRTMPRRWLTTGTIIASFAWLLVSAALSFYLSNFADYNATYGSLGAAIGLMMWMWLSAVVVLAGAQIDVVIDRLRQGGRLAAG